MSNFVETIDIEVPLESVYRQWVQFEHFPRFMESVKFVRRMNDTKFQWVAQIGGQVQQWEAEIKDIQPYRSISWTSSYGAKNEGKVRFQTIDADVTRLHLEVEYEPDGFIETVGTRLGVVERHMVDDLQRFKDYIETQH